MVDTGQAEGDSDTDSELPLFKIRDSNKAVASYIQLQWIWK